MIPKIIHQSWKAEEVPKRWQPFQASWRTNHPDYEYKYWTDEANRAFVAAHFPHFLPVYDGYALPICRADLARYLVVCHYGGLYVDMDFESLRPVDELLADRQLVFSLEPDTHSKKPSVLERGLSRIVCNAFFASVPQHPFWDHFLPTLLETQREANILDIAGPFALTRACDSYPRANDISLIPSNLVYPIDHFLKPVEGSENCSPYAIHHWHGTWWRETILRNAWDRIRAQRNTTDLSAAD